MALLDVCLMTVMLLAFLGLATLGVGSLLLALLAAMLGFSLPLWTQTLGALTALAALWACAWESATS